jgi:hypothetical protein
LLTTCGAGLLTSSWALTFWICGACSFTVAARAVIPDFQKKLENHEHALALYFMHYNFCRIHQTLRVTPAMEAGITDHVWSLDEVIDLP